MGCLELLSEGDLSFCMMAIADVSVNHQGVMVYEGVYNMRACDTEDVAGMELYTLAYSEVGGGSVDFLAKRGDGREFMIGFNYKS